MPLKLDWEPSAEIPNLSGKVLVVTGGTAGLGRETVVSFAAHGAKHIYFTGRSQGSAEKLIADVKTKSPDAPITFVRCDLASLDSVQEAAKHLTTQTDRLDICMLNAGIMGTPPGQTEAGYEIQFGTNHVGQALLVKLLTPLLESTAANGADVRLVWNSSRGHMFAAGKGVAFDTVKTPQAGLSGLPFGILSNWYRYGQSKMANILYARAYAKHHPSITSVSIHPGVSWTGLVTSLNLLNRWFVYATTFTEHISAEDCAKNQQWAAVAPKGTGSRQVENGEYYEPVGVKTAPMGVGKDDAFAEKLWDWTQKELEGYSL